MRIALPFPSIWDWQSTNSSLSCDLVCACVRVRVCVCVCVRACVRACTCVSLLHVLYSFGKHGGFHIGMEKVGIVTSILVKVS